ncbi:hypothetical protein, conserved [Plasmodium vivax]|nr:hypothetical protein, conserved [Plasmodium vivax]
MSNDILDITIWKEQYPFLKEVFLAYDDYNNNYFDDFNESTYDSLCYSIIEKANGDVKKHNDICKKLMRNLRHFSSNSIYYEISRDRCNILFHWLYNFLDKGKITYDIIAKCFEIYDFDRLRKTNINKKCYYDKDDKYYEPTKITLLDIFNDNTAIITNTLKDNNIETSNRGRKYVCECVKIYKHMYETYCPNGKEKKEDYKSTCLKLYLFKASYKHFLDNLSGLYFEMPSLDDKGTEFSKKCPPDEQNTLLSSGPFETRHPSLGKGLPASDEDSDGPLSGELRGPLVNGDSSMKKSITTTIGTVAGASSLLALLYKFSPGGNWIRSGFRGGRGRINSNLYVEGPNELLFDGMEHNGFNSYSIGYEAM